MQAHSGCFRAGLGEGEGVAADPSDRAGPRERAQEKLPRARLGDPEGMGSERATWVGLKPRLISGRRVPAQPKPNPSPWSLTGAPLPPALPPQPPPHTHSASPHLLRPLGQRPPSRPRRTCRCRSGARCPPLASGPRSARSNLEDAGLRGCVRSAPVGAPVRGTPSGSPPTPSPCPVKEAEHRCPSSTGKNLQLRLPGVTGL